MTSRKAMLFMKYEHFGKCKGSFKDSQRKCKYDDLKTAIKQKCKGKVHGVSQSNEASDLKPYFTRGQICNGSKYLHHPIVSRSYANNLSPYLPGFDLRYRH